MLSVEDILHMYSTEWTAESAMVPMPSDLVAEITSMTTTQLKRASESGRFDDLDRQYFNRASSVYSRFDTCSYSAVEIGWLTDLPISLILAYLEDGRRTLIDWLTLKGITMRDRGAYTILEYRQAPTNVFTISRRTGINQTRLLDHMREIAATEQDRTRVALMLMNSERAFSQRRTPIPFSNPRKAVSAYDILGPDASKVVMMNARTRKLRADREEALLAAAEEL